MATNGLSVVIITLNADSVLEQCLESASFADEIIIVDSGSQDETLAIASRYGVRIIEQPFLGFGPQKQFAVEQAQYDWVLCLDADERVSEELRASIETEMKSPSHSAYKMARCNRFMGRWLKHGAGYPDYNVRLFDCRFWDWSDDPVHEIVRAKGAGVLVGDLLHESDDGLDVYLAKQNRYTSIQAEHLFGEGKRVGVNSLLLSPIIRFIKYYILRLGFLDGVPGLFHALIGSFISFSKYAKLIELQRKGR